MVALVVLVESGCADSLWLCWLSVFVWLHWLCWLSVVMPIVSGYAGCADCQWLYW